MARYRRIHTKIWSDPEFLDLAMNTKLVFVYLLTNDALNEAGLYSINYRKIAFDIGIQIKEAEEAVEELCLTSLIEYDKEQNTVWIVKFLKYQFRSPNLITSVNRDLSMNLKSDLSAKLYEMYNESWPGLSLKGVKAKKKKTEEKKPHDIPLEYLGDCQTLTQTLMESIKERKPDFKFSGNPLRDWPAVFCKMMKLDNRDPQKIKKIIAWVAGDSFWKNNILSAEKLRKQFDKLEMRMSDSGGPAQSPKEQVDPIIFIEDMCKRNGDYKDEPAGSGKIFIACQSCWDTKKHILSEKHKDIHECRKAKGK